MNNTEDKLDGHNDGLIFELKNKDPKENPITHEITSLQDIANAVTVENIDGFIVDFKGALLAYLLVKETVKESNPNIELIFPSFTWTDDWKPQKTTNNK